MFFFSTFFQKRVRKCSRKRNSSEETKKQNPLYFAFIFTNLLCDQNWIFLKIKNKAHLIFFQSKQKTTIYLSIYLEKKNIEHFFASIDKKWIGNGETNKTVARGKKGRGNTHSLCFGSSSWFTLLNLLDLLRGSRGPSTVTLMAFV